jgi:hypothetical protein
MSECNTLKFIIGNMTAITILVLAFSYVTGTIAYHLGHEHGAAEVQNLAIKAGVGRWVVNPQTGERKFVYGREE